MAAPIGNRFWENRSKHGRDKLFATPELLWGAACEYFNWCNENPWIKTDFKGSMVEKVSIPTERPLTITGLCLYLGCSSSYFREFKSNLPKGAEDFLTVITRIEEIILTQQIEGALVGAFNPNLTARINGITEKSESKVTIEQPLFGDDN